MIKRMMTHLATTAAQRAAKMNVKMMMLRFTSIPWRAICLRKLSGRLEKQRKVS